MTILRGSHRRMGFRPCYPHTTAIAVALICLAWQAGPREVNAASPGPSKPDAQATVKPLGSGINQITLVPTAAKRLDVKAGQVSKDASGKKIAPYASILYDLGGDAWVYVVPAPLTFVRQRVVVELIEGEFAYLKEGPAPGTQVVTVGVPELYGTETGLNGG